MGIAMAGQIIPVISVPEVQVGSITGMQIQSIFMQSVKS